MTGAASATTIAAVVPTVARAPTREAPHTAPVAHGLSAVARAAAAALPGAQHPPALVLDGRASVDAMGVPMAKAGAARAVALATTAVGRAVTMTAAAGRIRVTAARAVATVVRTTVVVRTVVRTLAPVDTAARTHAARKAAVVPVVRIGPVGTGVDRPAGTGATTSGAAVLVAKASVVAREHVVDTAAATAVARAAGTVATTTVVECAERTSGAPA